MNGNELLKKLKKIAKDRNMELSIDSKRGKGSHITVTLGERKTVLKDRKKEIGEGLLRAILNQLGLDKDDLQ